MSITDELRKWAEDNTMKDRVLTTCPPQHAVHGVLEMLLRIADRIDAEYQKACDDAWDNGYEADYLGIEKWLAEHPQAMEHHGWVRLPVDADGVPIRVGDVLDECAVNTYAFLPAKVVGYYECCGEIMPIVENDGEFHVKPNCVCHRHAPTVEDVLRDFAQEMSENMGMYTGEAIDADEWRDADARTVEKYAAKLRLAGGDAE